MYTSINFIRWQRDLPEHHQVGAHSGIWLEWRNWDDAGWMIRFVAYVPGDRGWVNLGQVVIAVREIESGDVYANTWRALGGDRNHPPPTLESLDMDYITSMGTTMDYYQWFVRHDYDFLIELADINLPQAPKRRWAPLSVIQNGFLRGSAAKKVFAEVPSLFDHSRPDKLNLSFEYATPIHVGEPPARIAVTLDPREDFPRRVNVIIGPNGAGKTTLLYNVARDLAEFAEGEQPPSRIVQPPQRAISRQIIVSNSPFDRSRWRELEGRRSIAFVGLTYLQEGTASSVPDDLEGDAWAQWLAATFSNRDSLVDALIPRVAQPNAAALASLLDDRQNWRVVLEGILPAGTIESLLRDPDKVFATLSSGQQAVVLSLSGLAAELDQEAIVLLDEPEAHLHPWHIAQYSRALHLLLEERRCFALIATHSAFFLKDVPTDCVHVVERLSSHSSPTGHETRTHSLGVQSLGASEALLRREAFELKPGTGYWAEQFRRMRRNSAPSEISAAFDPPLEPEVEAMIYLLPDDEEL